MTKTLKTIAAASTLILGLTSASALYAQQGPIGSGASTPGAMMGGYGMGPGMMAGYGSRAGYGSGGMGGYGPGMMGMMDMMGMMGGMGPGMMGGMGPGMMGGMGPGMMGGYGMGPGTMWGYGPGSYGALNLSGDQQQKIARIQGDIAQKQWPLMNKLREERYTLAQLTSGKLDAAAARQAYQAMAATRKQLFDNALEAREKIDAVLAKQ